MSGRSKLTPLQARKQLLLTESELNRQNLVREWKGWKHQFELSKHELASIGSLASLTTKLAATFAAAGRAIGHSHNGKRSWITTLVNSATTGTSLWYLARSIRRRFRTS
ncbi:MAG TPA: hypothetical protein VF988_07040 [Verrucomicrobiae bacterium]